MNDSNSELTETLTPCSCPLCGDIKGHDELTQDKYRLIRCGICNLVYSDRLNIPSTLYDQSYDEHPFYQKYFRQADKAGRSRIHIAWAWRHFFRHTNPRVGKLLDIGCATGAFMFTAKNRGWTPEGLDISQAAAEVAQKVSGVDVRVGTLETCEFAEKSFDAVTAWEVLEHLSDPRQFLRKIYHLLKPGGIVAISTPNWNSPWERKTKDDNRRPPYHLTFWSNKSIAHLLIDEGFNEIFIREKPIAWAEEVGRIKWIYLPVAIIRSLLLSQKGNRLLAIAKKPEE